MKKYFLTTALMGMFIAPVFGADKIITSENTCTVDVLGVSDNNAVANTIATWDLIDYECPAGQYLLETETSVECTECPTGSYCPGGTYTVESENMGKTACPSTHPNSVQGAGADTQCYTACTVATANLAHATAVSGNDYFGTGVDTCGATACEMGYEVDGSRLELVEKDPLVPISLTDAGTGSRYVDARGTSTNYGTVDAIPEDSVTAPNTWATAYSEGVVYGKASCQPKIDPASKFIYYNQFALMNGQMSLEDFESYMLPLAGKEKTDYAVKILTGVMDGSVSEEEMRKALTGVFMTEPNANYATDSSGQYCYCQMDGFTPTGGTREIVTSAPWALLDDYSYGSADSCAGLCASHCAGSLRGGSVDGLAFRAAVVGALEAVETGGMCKITENNCPAGQYLAIVGDAMMCVPCKSGSYCPGGVYTIESENKGTNICPSGYTQSDAGASADTQCYRACSVDMVAHATAVTGNDYFGTGVDTCGATACETGYHVDGGGIELIEKDPLAPISLTDEGIGSAAVTITGVLYDYNFNFSDSGLTEKGTWATAYSEGTVYGKASCQPKMDPASEYMNNNLFALLDGQMSLEDFLTGLEPLAGPVKTEYVKNTLIGYATGTISEEEAQKRAVGVFDMEPNANYATDSTGQYCYCQMDGFTPTGGTKEIVTSAPWVFHNASSSADYCADNCAIYCADSLRYDGVDSLALRAAVVGSLSAVETGKTCAANILNIVWDPANKGAVIENQCT